MAMLLRRALLSVSDKRGLTELAHGLHAHGVELVSTGGTAAALRAAGLPVTEVSAVTGFPEIMDGRVKTLHPRIHGGLLARPEADGPVMAEHGIGAFDLLVVNLYPFARTIAQPDVTVAAAIEQIDVGGPAMIRAAAKNHAEVLVLTDPAQYPALLARLGQAPYTLAERRALAAAAYAHTAHYDGLIADYLARVDGAAEPTLPETLTLRLARVQALRYGENPHQPAALYMQQGLAVAGVAAARVLQGKALSYNNLIDADSAWQQVQAFASPAVAIVKHANPCGVALAPSLLTAYERAYQTDPTSAFGGVLAFNRELDEETAQAILGRQFAELILAPAFSAQALAVLAAKPGWRLLELATVPAPATIEWRSIGTALLAQVGGHEPADSGFKIVSTRAPTATEIEDLRFAWQVARMVKSNAIVYARALATVGIGAGQMSRVDSARLAGLKAQAAGLEVAGAVMASDAFFPFRDGIDAAAAAGISAVIQPGGSVRDDEVIAAANEHGMAMVLTGVRQFRH